MATLISDNPSFHKLHFHRSLVTNGRTSFFIPAYDKSTDERHFLSAPLDGGPVTHLITLRNAQNRYYHVDDTVAEHLNGSVLFTSRNETFVENFAFIVNPATFITSTFEFMIFYLSTYSWRHIPVDLEKLPPFTDRIDLVRNTVCVDNIIHVMLYGMLKILAYDLITEKFSIIDLPQGAIPLVCETWFIRPSGEETV